jgi:hypothetical protein
MPSSIRTPKKSQSKIIDRLAGNASSVAAMLSAIGVLPASEQHGALLACSSLADAVACELSEFAGFEAIEPIESVGTSKAPGQRDSQLDLVAAFNNINGAIFVLSNLIGLALSECEQIGPIAGRIDSTLRAAERYFDDVTQANKTLIRQEIAATRANELPTAMVASMPALPVRQIIDDLVFDIESATLTVGTLLEIATEDCMTTELNRAFTAMMAAKRYLDDIEVLANKLRDLEPAARQGGAS